MNAGTDHSAATDQFEGIEWNAWLSSRIADPLLCPICMRPELVDARCRHCGVELCGETGKQIWQASQTAAKALNLREQLLRAAPRMDASSDAFVHSLGHDAVALVPATSLQKQAGPQGFVVAQNLNVTPSSISRRSNATVQSMFALAGAGLVAVAAIVFTFFNPDLDDRVLRSVIVAAVTLLFLGGAWWLAQRGNASSAETVGGLAAVFVGIDVWALAQSASDERGTWLLAAFATLLCAVAALLLSRQVGLRSWSFVAMVGFALVPAMFGYAAGAQLAAVLGHLGVVVVVAAQFEWLPRFTSHAEHMWRGKDVEEGQSSATPKVKRRISVAGRPERNLLSALQILVALSSVPMLGTSLLRGDGASVGALLFGFVIAAVFSARHTARGFWSFVAGASAASVLPTFAFGAYFLGAWHLTLLTITATAGAVMVVVLAPRLSLVSIPLLSYAAISVPAVFSLPTLLFFPTMLSSSPRWADTLPGSAELPWSFVANALILTFGAAICSRFASRSAKTHSSMTLLSALCSVLAVVFALLATFMITRLLLGLLGFEGRALESIVASIGLVIAIAATLARRTPVLIWFTVLAVTTVPFIASVTMVIEQRSGWTALTTACMFGLALTLLAMKRPGLGAPLRAAAAAMLMPSLAVLLVCLGAEILKSSASPVVLPLIAALIAIVLAVSKQLFGLVPGHPGSTRMAFEASTLMTAAITVVLSLTRDAAGLGTACIVLLLLGFGTVLFAHFSARTYGWWLAGLSFTGALWCALGLAEVATFEAYLLPPALGVSLLAVWLSTRGSRQTALYSAGLATAIIPILFMLARGGEATMARAVGLLVGSWALLAIARLLFRGLSERTAVTSDLRGAPLPAIGSAEALPALAALGVPTLIAAMMAGLAGAVFAMHLGIGEAPFMACLAVSAAGAGAMLLAANGLRRAVDRFSKSRWPEAPAVIALAAGCWWAIDRNWVDIWSMWGIMLAYLVAMVIVSRRQLVGRGPLIPAALLCVIALVTAIVAWSPRDLRVDVFSLPLGLMLTLAGALALRHRRSSLHGTGQHGEPGAAVLRGWQAISRWPVGQHRSWPLLGPGIMVTVLASIIATFTDPQTWRAILVMVIALIAMLLGARLRLAAPFLIGLIVLPVENVFVFAVQIGRGIDSMPWWITLAAIGAVLLSIAVVSEQRSGGQQGLMARMRDLD